MRPKEANLHFDLVFLFHQQISYTKKTLAQGTAILWHSNSLFRLSVMLAGARFIEDPTIHFTMLAHIFPEDGCRHLDIQSDRNNAVQDRVDILDAVIQHSF